MAAKKKTKTEIKDLAQKNIDAISNFNSKDPNKTIEFLFKVLKSTNELIKEV